MKKALVFLLFSFITFSVSAQYADQWKKVDSLAKKQLPESALKEVENIFKDAQKTGDFSQTVKAFIYKMQFTLEINPNEAPKMINDFEEFTNKNANVEQKALLHSMTAELYWKYYSTEQYAINQRSMIVGYVPDDIKEWSKNLFFDKINQEFNLSLKDADALKKANAEQFEPLLEQGKDSKTLQPTLYDFLTYRAINILKQLSNATIIKNPLDDKFYFLPAAEFSTIKLDTIYNESAENQLIKLYQSLIAFHQQENNIDALIHADLSRLNYVREKSEHLQKDEFFVKTLENLYKKYADNEAVVPDRKSVV